MLAGPGPALALVLLASAVIAAPGGSLVRHRLRQLSGGAEAGGPSHSQPASTASWLAAVAGLGLGSVGWASVGGPAGVAVGSALAVAAAIGCRRILTAQRANLPHPLLLAGTCDLIAACLGAGLAMEQAARAVAEHLPAEVGAELSHAAELLALGADPVSAWRPCMAVPVIGKLARAARRSSASGAELAGVAAAAASDARAEAGDAAEAGAQRAAVLIAGPLGVCFLPAFLCLGVVPVVIGLADRLMTPW
ncbi:MAG: putative secreted protein [Pseudonocardia sp.]|nr:putative secreted protein [Pseudonocardia sp.]